MIYNVWTNVTVVKVLTTVTFYINANPAGTGTIADATIKYAP